MRIGIVFFLLTILFMTTVSPILTHDSSESIVVYASSIYEYYWFRKNVYFTYLAELGKPLSFYRGDIFDKHVFLGVIDSFLINWSIVEITNEWIYINYSVIFKTESGEIILSRLIKVNSRTLEAYIKPVYAEDPERREKIEAFRPAVLHFPRVDNSEYLWLAEFPFILRPGSSVKFLGDLRGPIGGGHLRHFLWKNPELLKSFLERRGIEGEAHKVLWKINEFVTNLSSILTKYEYWRDKNYTSLALSKGPITVTTTNSTDLDYVFYRACVVDSTITDAAVLSTGVFALREPPYEKGYVYGRINLGADRLASTKSPGDLGVIINEIQRWGSKHIELVLVDPVNEIVVVLDNGRVVCIDSYTPPGLYDVVSGILVEMSMRLDDLLGIFYIEDLLFRDDLRIGVLHDIKKTNVKIYLIDTNINFERPVIGVKPPEGFQTTIERPSRREQPGLFELIRLISRPDILFIISLLISTFIIVIVVITYWRRR